MGRKRRDHSRGEGRREEERDEGRGKDTHMDRERERKIRGERQEDKKGREGEAYK